MLILAEYLANGVLFECFVKSEWVCLWYCCT